MNFLLLLYSLVALINTTIGLPVYLEDGYGCRNKIRLDVVFVVDNIGHEYRRFANIAKLIETLSWYIEALHEEPMFGLVSFNDKGSLCRNSGAEENYCAAVDVPLTRGITLISDIVSNYGGEGYKPIEEKSDLLTGIIVALRDEKMKWRPVTDPYKHKRIIIAFTSHHYHSGNDPDHGCEWIHRYDGTEKLICQAQYYPTEANVSTALDKDNTSLIINYSDDPKDYGGVTKKLIDNGYESLVKKLLKRMPVPGYVNRYSEKSYERVIESNVLQIVEEAHRPHKYFTTPRLYAPVEIYFMMENPEFKTRKYELKQALIGFTAIAFSLYPYACISFNDMTSSRLSKCVNNPIEALDGFDKIQLDVPSNDGSFSLRLSRLLDTIPWKTENKELPVLLRGKRMVFALASDPEGQKFCAANVYRCKRFIEKVKKHNIHLNLLYENDSNEYIARHEKSFDDGKIKGSVLQYNITEDKQLLTKLLEGFDNSLFDCMKPYSSDVNLNLDYKCIMDAVLVVDNTYNVWTFANLIDDFAKSGLELFQWIPSLKIATITYNDKTISCGQVEDVSNNYCARVENDFTDKLYEYFKTVTNFSTPITYKMQEKSDFLGALHLALHTEELSWRYLNSSDYKRVLIVLAKHDFYDGTPAGTCPSLMASNVHNPYLCERQNYFTLKDLTPGIKNVNMIIFNEYHPNSAFNKLQDIVKRNNAVYRIPYSVNTPNVIAKEIIDICYPGVKPVYEQDPCDLTLELDVSVLIEYTRMTAKFLDSFDKIYFDRFLKHIRTRYPKTRMALSYFFSMSHTCDKNDDEPCLYIVNSFDQTDGNYYSTPSVTFPKSHFPGDVAAAIATTLTDKKQYPWRPYDPSQNRKHIVIVYTSSCLSLDHYPISEDKRQYPTCTETKQYVTTVPEEVYDCNKHTPPSEDTLSDLFLSGNTAAFFVTGYDNTDMYAPYVLSTYRRFIKSKLRTGGRAAPLRSNLIANFDDFISSLNLACKRQNKSTSAPQQS